MLVNNLCYDSLQCIIIMDETGIHWWLLHIKRRFVDKDCYYLLCVPMVIMLMFFVRFILIIAIYNAGVNSINQTDFDEFGETYEDFTQQLVSHAASMLCNFQSNLVHVYYHTTLRTNTAERLIFLVNKCSSLMIIRWVCNKNCLIFE